MSDIVEFLRARLDEDEREARVCLNRWIEGHGTRRRWDRQLREVEAKRRMVVGHPCDDCGAVNDPCLTLLYLASVYSDHPDYDPSWRV